MVLVICYFPDYKHIACLLKKATKKLVFKVTVTLYLRPKVQEFKELKIEIFHSFSQIEPQDVLNPVEGSSSFVPKGSQTNPPMKIGGFFVISSPG